MDALTIVLIAAGLAMDAFAVSIAKGIVIKHQRQKNGFATGFVFRRVPNVDAYDRMVSRDQP